MKEQGIFGDVIISTDTAKRQAKGKGASIWNFDLVVTASFISWVTVTRRKSERMWRKTNALLKLVS
jgi:hypothetical protein